MYGDGGAEEIVADAIRGQRQDVFVVTKVYPHNASREKLPRACERSLKRLRIDAIDLYLLHWRERTPLLQETVETFEKLRADGKIKRWGVSNFDVDDMEELLSLEHGRKCAANQVLYNLQNREIEFELLPFLTSNIKPQPSERGERDRRQSREGSGERARAASEFQTSSIRLMAYSPVGHGRGLLENQALKKIAKRHAATPAQIALAWVLRQPGIIAIPKARDEKHVRDNARSIEIKLTKEDLVCLDRKFPPPKIKKPVSIL
jgi:diketogulonate reductase-like aldo/keto reductase